MSYYCPKERRIRISKSLKDYFKKNGHWRTGSKSYCSKKTREKISKALMGKKNSLGYKHSEKTKKRMSEAHIGKCNIGRGKNHPCWKGGRITKNYRGYVLKYAPNHPNCSKKGYVFEHRLEMEKKLGRYLKSTEIVHHINGKVNDNRLSNLYLFGSNSEHIKFHRRCLKQYR